MAVIQAKYPSTSSVAFTITLASLASDATNMLAGRASTAVDNSTNLDTDHLVSGQIKLGTSPSAGVVEVWAYAPVKIVTGTATYPDSITGTDAAKTMTSFNIKTGAMALLWSYNTDATTGAVLNIKPTSIAAAFGNMPNFYGLFVVQGTGVALDSTGTNHFLHYDRLQQQVN